MFRVLFETWDSTESIRAETLFDPAQLGKSWTPYGKP
jgi:hypothetical protein